MTRRLPSRDPFRPRPRRSGVGRYLRPVILLALVLLVAGAATYIVQALAPGRSAVDYSTWHGAFGYEPGPLDPARAVSVTDGAACALVYNGLLRPDEQGRPSPDLAWGWETSPDGLVFTFHLREGVRFHDGSELDAADVIFSFERILDPATGSSRAWVLQGIEGAEEFMTGRSARVTGLEAPDPLTVRITLARPLAHFPSLLCMPAAYVVSPEAVMETGDDFGYHPVGTGPWILSHWREGVEMELTANPAYFDAPPRLERLVFRFIPDPATRQAEFEAGNLETLGLTEENVEHFSTHPVWSKYVRSSPELAVVYVVLNCSRPPLDNVLVRRALNHAVNREALLAAVRPGRCELADGSIPPGLGDYETAWTGYEYDPALARSLLARAGYPDGFEMDLLIRAGGLSVLCAEPIQAELGRVGVKVRIVQLEAQAFGAAVGDDGDPDAALMSWVADYADPENFLFPLFHSGNSPTAGNYSRFSDPVVDRLLEDIHLEADRDRRDVLCQAAEKAVFESAPWIPLYYPIQMVVCQPEVRGYKNWLIFNGNKMTEVWLEPPASGDRARGEPGSPSHPPSSRGPSGQPPPHRAGSGEA